MDFRFKILPLALAWMLSAGSASAAVPTFTSLPTVTGGIEDTPVTISYASLAPHADGENAFVFKSLVSGVLLKNGTPVGGNGTIVAGESWTWHPLSDQNGVIDAFRIRARNADGESASDILVRVNVTAVNDAPSFTIGGPVTRNEDAGAVSISNWAQNISAGPADESGQTLTFVVVSNSNPGLFSAGPAVSANGTLSFTTAPDANGTANIQLKLTDNGGTDNGGQNESAAQPFIVTLNAQPDPPELAGALQGTQANPLVDSAASGEGPDPQPIFGNITLTDPDHQAPSAETVALQVTLAEEAVAMGTLTFPSVSGLSTSADGRTFTISARSPANAQTALRAARFTPTANAMPVGIHSFGITVVATDSTSRTDTLSGSIHVRSVNDPPLLVASLSPSTISDGSLAAPFRLTVSDPDVGDTFSVTIEEDGSSWGTFTFPGNPITGTAEQVATAVQNVSYRPNALSATRTANIVFKVKDVHPGGGEGTEQTQTRVLTIQFTNSPPEIAGVAAEPWRTTDDPAALSVRPFQGVTITDPNVAQTLTVTLSMDDAEKGTFDPPGPFTGSASEVTAALRDVIFRPAPDRVPINETETAIFTLTVDDSLATRTNDDTRVIVTSVNGAPIVLWNGAGFPAASSPHLLDPGSDIEPFSGVTLRDEGEIQVRVSLDVPGKGELTNLGGFTETAAGSRVYEMAGMPEVVEPALQALRFVPAADYPFPAGQPGRTDFTIEASDSILNLTTRVLPVVLLSDSRSFLVTSVLDDPAVPGTLRHAIANAKNNDAITFALPAYPAVIRLSAAHGPLVLDKHLTLNGPGADKLTITGDSNSNGIADAGDVQIFRVFAGVTVRGLRLARGYASTGGAAFVGRAQPGGPAGSLRLVECTVAHCLASQWGGGVDVDDASLTVERCLFQGNAVAEASGLGGGAVSLYTSETCRFTNTTFSGNSQKASGGYGGGAIYVENRTPVKLFNTHVTHCTFSANTDAASKGSSIHSNVSNSKVQLANNIFADFSARNLQVAGGGEIVSNGGNLSNDATATTLLVGGVPQLATLLNKPSDKINTDPKLAPLAAVEGPTQAHRPAADSPSIGAAVSGHSAVDQRGVVRAATTESGALAALASGRLLVNEISANSVASGVPQFIEFYNPRDQAAMALNGLEVWIDGTKRHVFSGQTVNPGFGIIVRGPGTVTPANASTPVVAASEGGTLNLMARGRIELRAPEAAGGKVLHEVAYVGVFASSASPASTLDFGTDSLTLAPQFSGAAMVPHRLVQPPPNGGVLTGATGAASSPGADTAGTPFGEANAYPIATLDRVEITEDELATLDVLANDLDADGSDELFVVDLNPAVQAGPPAASKATLTTAAGATVTVTPTGNPLRGTAISYDPRTAFKHLPEGARATDTFAYSIVDVGGGPIAGYSGAGPVTIVSAPSHRLASGESVTISGAATAAYNGTRVVTAIDDDTFSIAVAFAGNPPAAGRGRWRATVPRSPTARSQALVEVSILGRNDPPTPMADTLATPEDTVLRILADPDHAGGSLSLDTDALYPAPRQLSALGILANDSDPDTDDQPFRKLRVVGVCQASPVTGYSGTPGTAPVTVTAAGHGLGNGTSVLISGYGGHPSYNGFHAITLIDENTFTIPVVYADNAPAKGLWALLGDDNRLSTTSDHGAAVNLEIRANRAHTNIVYNPRTSAYLDGLAVGETAADGFHYAVEDTHGAVSLARITVNVSGVNDAPQPQDDPPALAGAAAYLTGGMTLPDFLRDSRVLYVLPGGSSGRANATLHPAGADAAETLVVSELVKTDEDSAVILTAASLLANDSDIDRSDTLSIELASGHNLSREGAAISLSGQTLTYDPRPSQRLQSLARGERLVDSFHVTIFDGTARVTSLVAVLVEGRNDRPVAVANTVTIPENQLLTISPPGLLGNDSDRDQDTSLPDNRKFMLPLANAGTTVWGARVDVELALREGDIDGVAAVGGNPARTAILSAGHGLATGEEVVLLGNPALEGQFPVVRIDADRFSVGVPFDASFTGGGTWNVLASAFRYDPRQSLAGPGAPSFTLDGLAQGQTFTDKFTYTLLDGSFLFANDDVFRVEADRANIELDVLLNDANLDGIATSRRIVETSPLSGNGTLVVNEGESLIYTPEVGFVGDEHFTYTIEDDLGNRATALVTVRVTVRRLNGNLQANADDFTVAAGQSPLLAVLANDDIIPATGSPLTIAAIATVPSHGGTATIENGAIRYTPAASATYPFTETFSYTISGGGAARATATVTARVVDRSGTLNVRADDFSVAAGSAGNVLDVLHNDNILPGTGEALNIVSVTAPAHGTAVIDGGALAYTPAAGFLGTDSFSYSVEDGFGGTGSASVTVRVGHLVTNSDIFSVRFDDPTKTEDDGFTTLDVLANDGVLQAPGGSLEITAVSPGSVALGQMTVAPDKKSLRFDPAAGATGQQDFTYTVADTTGRTATATVAVIVVAQGVRGSSDFFTVQADSSENPLAVLANDIRISELPGDLVIAALGTGANAPDQGGAVVIAPELDRLIYTPAPGFAGEESFTYVVTDGENNSTARVTVRVTTGELAAAADEFFAFRGSAANVLDVLANDRVIPDAGQSLSITAVGLDPGNPVNPAHRGTLSIAGDSSALLYTPAPENTAHPYAETFTYEISDGGTRRAEAVVRIEVLDRVGARSLDTNHDRFSVRADSTANVLAVLANDNIRPATATGWTITRVTPPTPNVCSPFLAGDFLNPTSFSAKLAAQGSPVSQFLWSRFAPASRTLLASGSTPETLRRNTLIAEFNAVVSGPGIHDATRFAGVVLREQTQGLLDEMPSGEQLIVLNRLLLEDAYPDDLRPQNGNGATQISGPNIVYVPAPGFVGSERFTYHVSDGLGGTGSAEVIVRTGDISVSDDAFSVLAGKPATLDVTANDGILRDPFPAVPQPDSADFSLAPEKAIVVSPPGAGIAVVDGTTVRYVPPAAFSGTATLTYWVKDDSGCTYPGTVLVDVRTPGEDRATAVVTINVTGVNDPPVLTAAATATGDKSSLRPFENATIVDVDDQGRQFVRVRITFPAGQGVLAGAFTLVSPGVLEFYGSPAEATAALRSLVFSPFENRIPVGQTETTIFSVSMDDGFVSTPVVATTGRTTVTPVNDPPVISGTVAAQKLYQFGTLRPFVGVEVVEVDNNGLQPLQVTVAIDAAEKGTLSNLGGFTEQPAGSGIYVFGGTAGSAANALRGMVFTPTPDGRVTPSSPETAVFQVSASDGVAPQVVDHTTSVIVLHAELGRVLPLAPDGADASQAAAEFGTSVALSRNTLVVGSPARGGSGRVFVYERNAGVGSPWGQVAELVSADIVAGDSFGRSVAIDGDFIAVGASQADPGPSNSGAIYVFHRNPVDPNAWSQVAKLIAPAAAAGDSMGTAVAIHDGTILAGAPLASVGGAFRGGKVHVFTRGAGGPGSWTFAQTLVATGTAHSGTSLEGDYFGQALAMDGGTAVIGAPGDNRTSSIVEWDFGSAYIFERSGGIWSQTHKLNIFADPEAQPFDSFGSGVAIRGGTVVVGASRFDGRIDGAQRENSGGAFIYGRDHGGVGQWGLVKKLVPSDGLGGDQFGAAVSLAGDLLVVGAPRAAAGGPSNGAAHVHQRNLGGPAAWGRLDRLSPGASMIDDRFGASCASDGFTAAVGSAGDNPTGLATAGSARIYQFQHDLGPRHAIHIPDQLVAENQAFTFALPVMTFGDPIYPGVELEARLADGSALPGAAWLKFDPVNRRFTGTPTPQNNADYQVVVHAINPLGTRVMSNAFHVRVALDPARALQRAYSDWAATRFTAAERNNPALENSVWGMHADRDGDGMPNVMEMLFGRSPAVADSPGVQLSRTGSQFSITFPVSGDVPAESLHVEWSTDVSAWSRANVARTTQVAGGVTWITATVHPASPQSRIFARIAVGP